MNAGEKPVQTLIRPLNSSDWEAVGRIYLEGLRTGNATFEESVPPWPDWDRSHLPFARLVAEVGRIIVGWAALSPVSSRCVYAGVAEVSFYVGAEHCGFGIGRALMEELIAGSERSGIWTLQAGVFPENAASLHVLEDCGFRIVGRRERLAKISGVWRDVILLERRSTTVGI